MPQNKVYLDRFALLFLRSWQEGSPETYREWQKAGVLEQKAYEASEKAQDRLADLVCDQGMDLHEAQEIVFPMYLHPPKE